MLLELESPTSTLGGLTATSGLVNPGVAFSTDLGHTGFEAAGNNGLLMIVLITPEFNAGFSIWLTGLPGHIVINTNSTYILGPFDVGTYGSTLQATGAPAGRSMIQSYYLAASSPVFSGTHQMF